MKYFVMCLCLAGMGLMVSCVENKQDERTFIEQQIAAVKSKYAPDKRVAIFQVEVKSAGKSAVLKGETNIGEAKTALLESLEKEGIQIADSIALLPEQSLGGQTYALVNNSVANIRSEARHSAELATQALLGTPLHVLKRQGEWYLVQTPDNYISWVDHGGIVSFEEEDFSKWKTAPKVIFTRVAGFSYSEQNEEAVPVSDLVLGNVLVKTGESGNFYEVQYPDGRQAFVLKKEAADLSDWLAASNPRGESLTSVAFQLMGAPYLWGGTSAKGMDCSGFTKTIYYMNGVVIPRDASQQVHAGVPVDAGDQWDELKVGDLLFFGTPATDDKKERVVHVGMWIGDKKFIHAAGKVRVSSVDPASELYDEPNTSRFLRARRYAPDFEGGISWLKEDLLN